MGVAVAVGTIMALAVGVRVGNGVREGNGVSVGGLGVGVSAGIVLAGRVHPTAPSRNKAPGMRKNLLLFTVTSLLPFLKRGGWNDCRPFLALTSYCLSKSVITTTLFEQ